MFFLSFDIYWIHDLESPFPKLFNSLLQFSLRFDLDEPDNLAKRPSLFVTYDGLQKKAEDLKNDETNAKTQLLAMDQSQNESIAHL